MSDLIWNGLCVGAALLLYFNIATSGEWRMSATGEKFERRFGLLGLWLGPAILFLGALALMAVFLLVVFGPPILYFVVTAPPVGGALEIFVVSFPLFGLWWILLAGIATHFSKKR